MATELSNHFKRRLLAGAISFDSDSFKIVLMNNSFTFDKDAHANYADVSASELPTGNGYTINTKTLSGVAIVEDDTNDRAEVTWSNAVWNAAGGDIGPSNGAIIFDDTEASDAIIGFIDFGAAQTASNGGSFTVSSITVRNT